MAATETVRTVARRYNGKCKICKSHHTALRSVAVTVVRVEETGKVLSHRERYVDPSNGFTVTHAPVTCCGREVYLQPVKGTRKPEIKCGPKCWGSKGHTCDCACGGRNHGCGKPPVETV